ncbi:FKBP-type peptidyl-prolyl cis-trans isomerase [Mangrovimonas sp. ST2L15]|uniref:FKBP-type peptidyl-prolyl cis-trans isomerase n=1 Tax=Mangrovimonas sp. ST2L15 TaxID=1645916 RepID=UPI0009E87873|nr:FKBP-type peptidyl-prolyl cis-trans isomerase [Mangrovimonas sp. ST2L15]
MKKYINVIFFFWISLIASTFMVGCSSNKKDKNIGFIKTSTGLKYKIIQEGKGVPVKAGQEVLIHETMSYMNDSMLFDSRTLPNPVKVLVGGSQAIAGVDEGLVGMKKGEIKKLIVPPALSKRTGAHIFPHPDSTLMYEVELIEILQIKTND